MSYQTTWVVYVNRENAPTNRFPSFQRGRYVGGLPCLELKHSQPSSSLEDFRHVHAPGVLAGFCGGSAAEGGTASHWCLANGLEFIIFHPFCTHSFPLGPSDGSAIRCSKLQVPRKDRCSCILLSSVPATFVAMGSKPNKAMASKLVALVVTIYSYRRLLLSC